MINFRVHEVRTGSVDGARHEFEQMITQLVRVSHPGVRSIQANPGDWGIDSFVGEIVDEVSVWQSKYFIDGVDKVQQRQIREAFKSVVEAAKKEGFVLRRWVLCIPVSMDAANTKWWDTWKRKASRESGVQIALWDETELRGRLNSIDATDVRQTYYESGASGDASAGERAVSAVGDPEAFESALFVRQLTEAGHVELDAAKLQFFNAELMAREITDKGVEREVRALVNADATLHGLWETRFNEACSGGAPRELPGLHATVMADVRAERASIAAPLKASLVHVQGMVHRVVENGRAGWVRDWRRIVSDHGGVPGTEPDSSPTEPTEVRGDS